MVASGVDTWQGDWAYGWIMWQVQVGQSESDTCHPCSGDTWHVHTVTRSTPIRRHVVDGDWASKMTWKVQWFIAQRTGGPMGV
jgi:hypothetical protein